MSLNSKLSGSNGKLSNGFWQKKAKEPFNGSRFVNMSASSKLLFLCLFGVLIGSSFWFFSGLWRKNGVLDLRKNKSEILLEQFNVSQEQLHALSSSLHEFNWNETSKCARISLYEMLPSNGVCSIKLVCSEEATLEEQCPAPDHSAPRNRGLFLFGSNPLLFGQNRENLYSDVWKACSWVCLGLIVGFIIRNNGCLKVAPQEEHDSHNNNNNSDNNDNSPSFSRTTTASGGKWRKKLLVMFLLVGIVVSFWLFWYIEKDARMKRKEMLTNMCEERARMLQDQFNVSMNHVHALAILVSTFHHGKQPSRIDQRTFEEYTERTSFERPLTSGVSYALRVVHSERDRVERQHGWVIKKMETEDQTLAQDSNPENLDPSPIKDEYAPVIFSQKTVSHIVSIDMMSGREDRENILRARRSGMGVLTSPFMLLKSNHLGVVLTFAVYNTHFSPNATPDQRINATVGYIGASYDVPSLVEKLLHQLASKQTIVVHVYDTTSKSMAIKMYGDDVIDTGPLHVSNLDFGDPARRHEMHCRFKHQTPPSWTAIMASMGVLVIFFLLGHIFDVAINRIAEVERDYQETRELTNRAKAAGIAKSQFLATVSHEIRTPMNGVLGMLQMLMDTELEANQLDYAQTAHDSGKDLISLINEVLDQAKIESGRLDLESVAFDLRGNLDRVLSLFTGKSHEKGIEMAVYVSHHVPDVVIGDPGRFRQIITNLVGNSIKFTKEKGHVLISVHMADELKSPADAQDEVLKQSQAFDTLSGLPVVDRQKSWEKFSIESDRKENAIKLLVTVEDTGVGILPEAQGSIFTPFVQGDSSTSRHYGGTGIGLSISKRLVELMGGEIGFVSECGTGSTFSFTATFLKGESQSLDVNPMTEFMGLEALVVDRRRIRAAVTRYHLRRLNISVEVALSVDSSKLFGMVLVDKEVWDMEGGEKIHGQLKKAVNGEGSGILLPKIFVLATTLNHMERKNLKSTGLVDNVIVKPLRLSVIGSSLQEVIGIGKRRKLSNGKVLSLGCLLRGKQILVVDDNIVNRRVAEGALKKYGAIVTCVDRGKDALKMLKPPHKFDACLMDLQMPEMDGFEATRKIRELERNYNERIEESDYDEIGWSHWHTPILAMTADVIQATQENCRKYGLDDYVWKPFFEEGQLYMAVARFF